MRFLVTSLLPVLLAGVLPLSAATPLTRIPGCRLIETDWADGDSFRIRTPGGKEHTVRLYGADCIEWHVNDDTDARRLRDQRRYFGISALGGSTQTSIDAAKGFGERASKRRAELLARPFTIHTAFADGRGDARYKRIYAFVETADGEDLSAVLVREGLARAFGVYRATPDGHSLDDWKDELADLELQAAKLGHGVWARTDWQRLPDERRATREELAESRAASRAGPPEPGSIDPNTAARDILMRLPGVGEKTANAIIEAREDTRFRKLSDLDRVPGIGPKTLEKLRPFLTFGA